MVGKRFSPAIGRRLVEGAPYISEISRARRGPDAQPTAERVPMHLRRRGYTALDRTALIYIGEPSCDQSVEIA